MGESALPVHHKRDGSDLAFPIKAPHLFSKRLASIVLTFIILVFTFRSFSIQYNSSQGLSNLHSSLTDYNINPLFWAPVLSDRADKSAYPANLFTPSALLENEFNPVSAVLLRVTDDDESITYVVKHLLKYNFISEIYIYNLVKSRPLTIENLKLKKDQLSTRIEILESDHEELKSMARFTTCATAARLYCYFQDDTYLNPYMDSLYTNFLRYPSLIHANAKPSHYENEMRWRFHNKDLKLHTGYADFRYGAFVPRWKVQNFLTQFGKSSLTKDNIRHAENYFAIWTNQYPWLLANPPQLAKGEKASDSDIGYPATLDLYTYDAVRHLQRSLASDTSEAPQDYFDRDQEAPYLYERDVRSSCANDRCLFITNMDPFVRPHQVTFDYQNTTSIPKLEKSYHALSMMPTSVEWDEYSYHRVVDNDPNSCWDTVSAPKEGDYFGLVLVGTVMTQRVVIDTPQEIKRPEKQLKVSVLQSGNTWHQCKIADRTVTGSGRITLDLLGCSNAKIYRAIKITFAKDQSQPLEICGMSIDSLTV